MSETEIQFTKNAAEKVHSLIVEEEEMDLNLRVYIEGGGCSGFQYGFTFDDQIADDDYQIIQTLDDDTQVTLLIDPLSYGYLIGSEIDYEESLQSSQFVIRNPNASTTCGCGSSFSVD